MSSEIERVYEELNRPSAAKLKIALTKEGIAFDAKDIEKLTRQDTGRQLLAPTYKYDGKIVSTDINERWVADVIDFTSNPLKKWRKIHSSCAGHLLAQILCKSASAK